jgi:hypothetical protein
VLAAGRDLTQLNVAGEKEAKNRRASRWKLLVGLQVASA